MNAGGIADGIEPPTTLVVIVVGGPVGIVEMGVVVCSIGVGLTFEGDVQNSSGICNDILDSMSDSLRADSVTMLTSCAWMSLMPVT